MFASMASNTGDNLILCSMTSSMLHPHKVARNSVLHTTGPKFLCEEMLETEKMESDKSTEIFLTTAISSLFRNFYPLLFCFSCFSKE